jgi:predicted SnoaL-like aldol condensation-catalyzing enzyme
MNSEDRKHAAIAFLQFAREGNRAGAERLVAPNARHHNPYFSAGMPALLDAMVAAAADVPTRSFDMKRVLCDGDYVVIHSHVRHQAGEPGVAVVHLFRFDGDRIAELWDVGQAIPPDNPNTDGMF